MLPENVVTTISGLCRRCYSCIRKCPAKAIKVEEGQAMVVPELCIGCGHCVEVCTQNAKKITSGVERANNAVSAKKSIACLAPSFVAHYESCHPGQVVHAVKQLGFDEVWEVAFGALLVTQEYKKMLSQGAQEHFIASACPVIVTLVEKHYSDLNQFLIPVVSPMVALGRYLKTIYGKKCKVVFIGPCIAKKEEAQDPMVQGAIDAVLTFSELDQMFKEKEIIIEDQLPVEWDSPNSGLGRLYPISGGLLRTASLELDPLSYEIIMVEGQENCLDFLKGIKQDKNSIQLADILFCDGCISGPMIKSPLNKYERQQLVAQYTRENMEGSTKKPPVMPDGLNLTRGFRDRSKEIPEMPEPTPAQIRAVLTELGKFSPEDELNCGACGYSSCREKARAVFRGLAENKMCLPFLITNLESYNIHLRKQLTSVVGMENMIGNSLAMQKVYQIINKVAPTDSTVLIRGKSGTGKELVAQALHQKSLRQGHAFVSVNCAALPDNLLESELFGHTKGAFTGAVSNKKGLFEEANGGTLFLDEIGDVSPQLQAKLLRVLQEGEFLRIGETVPRKSDVRIIAATNRDLEELIESKKFREDLFYRLNVVSIRLPNLVERRDDIPVLIKYFMDKFNTKHQKKVISINKRAMMALTNAEWPGNVRELENAIERAVILCEGREITEEDLPPSLKVKFSTVSVSSDEELINYNRAVNEYKQKLIMKALKEADGVQAQAARKLGIGRSTLNEIIKRLKIDYES
jgi:DNA-binding NtrC family response regulator/iron only hydrogenase large subunit-like protein